MRVISGNLRGKKLKCSSSKLIRPTQDRLKESLFNIIDHYYYNNLIGKNVLDLFAGSGSIGIEAISRGANKVVFVDSLKEATNLVKGNLINIPSEKFIILNGDSRKIKLKHLGLVFELVFLDPPYDSDLIKPAIDNLLEQQVISSNSIFVVESGKDFLLDFLNCLLSKSVGKNYFKVYKLK